MDKKLTLSLNASVVDRAKDYAKEQGISLSRMIENYLASLVPGSETEIDEVAISPLVNRLIGVIEISESADLEPDYTDYLLEKYK